MARGNVMPRINEVAEGLTKGKAVPRISEVAQVSTKEKAVPRIGEVAQVRDCMMMMTGYFQGRDLVFKILGKNITMACLFSFSKLTLSVSILF